MKITILIGLILLLCIDITTGIIGHYQYNKNYQSYWELATKASTIDKKIEGIDNFVSALESSNLKGKYNALVLTTPNNSFDYNLDALKSLQLRLHEIKGMDVSSFQYQTALQQITQQEQNEAGDMLDVFSGVWWLENHFFLWDWILIVNVVLLIGIIICSVLITNDY